MTPGTYTCHYCGLPFTPKAANRTQYCSRECYFTEKQRGTFEKRLVRLERRKRNCSICGIEYSAKRGVFCSEVCRKESARRKAKLRELRNYLARVVNCKECGVAFETVHGDKKRVFCSESCGTKHSKRTSKALRRARVRGIPYEPVDPFTVLTRDGWHCMSCSIETPRELHGSMADNAPELDHIIPLARGGKHVRSNLQCLCRRCNNLKGANSMPTPMA